MERVEPPRRRSSKPRHSVSPREARLSVAEHAFQIMIAVAALSSPRIGDMFSMTLHVDPRSERIRISVNQAGRGRTPLITHHASDADEVETRLAKCCRALLLSQDKEAARLSWTAGQRGSLTVSLLSAGSADAAHARLEAAR